MKEEDRVRGNFEDVVTKYGYSLTWGLLKESCPELLIKADDQSLPKDKDCTRSRRAFDGTQERHAFDTAYFAAQQDMLKDNWVKVK